MHDGVVLVVSGDRIQGPRMQEMLGAIAGLTIELAESGGQCLARLRALPPDVPVTAVVDLHLADISPLNLAGSLTAEYPGVGVVFVVTPLEDAVVRRAMLAGARAVMDRERLEEDLIPTVQRVAASVVRRMGGGTTGGDAADSGHAVVFTGGKGGAGKSVLAAATAVAAGLRDLDVGLLDLDLQFGDMAYLFDCSQKRTLVDMAQDLERGTTDLRSFGLKVSQGVTLYSPSPQPEHADLVAPKVSTLLNGLRAEHELVVVNTGAYWTLLHAELIDTADLSLFVLNPFASSVKATAQARGLCNRLGIADSQLGFVLNRVTGKDNVSVADVTAALRVREVWVVPEGGSEVTAAADVGGIGGLLTSRNQFAPAVNGVLDKILERVTVGVPKAKAG